MVHDVITQFCCCVKADLENVKVNGHDCILAKPFFWTLEFEFLIIFMCHEMFFFCIFSQPFKDVKNILCLWVVTEISTGNRLDLVHRP